MLLRSSRKQLQRRVPGHLVLAYEQLHLPWLCPALDNRSQRRHTSSTPAERPRSTIPLLSAPQTRKRPTLANEQRGRRFASPASPLPTEEGSVDDVPFDISRRGAPWDADGFVDLPPWDLTGLVRSPTEAVLNPDAYRHHSGLRNEVEEVHAVLVAYLQVGQFEAAATTLRRLLQLQEIGTPIVYQAYMAYLAALVSHIVVTRDQALLSTTRRWFNEEVRARGIKPSGTMVMLLVQASLRAEKKQKTSRAIRHFFHLAQQDGILDDALTEIESCFSDEEYGRVREAASGYFPVEASAESIEPNADVDPNRTAPEVKPHPQKGGSLKALQNALASFTQKLVVEEDVPKDWDEATVRQYRVEKDVNRAALERWRAEHEETLARAGGDSRLAKGSLGALLWKWHEAMIPLIRTELAIEMKTGTGSRLTGEMMGPLLRLMSASELSAITVNTVVRAMVRSEKERLIKVVSDVGKAVQDETTVELLKRRNRAFFKDKAGSTKERRKFVTRLLWEERHAAPDTERFQGLVPSGEKEWTMTTKVRVGAWLVALLMKAAKVDVPKPKIGTEPRSYETHAALTRKVEIVKGQRLAFLQMHSYFGYLLRRDPPTTLVAKHLPMLTPPVPWTGFRLGGYITQPVGVVRLNTQNASSREYVQLALEKGDMNQLFAGLDVLGRTGWRINKPVFEVMAQLWNTGEEFGSMPALNPKLEYPPEPEDPTNSRARRTHAVECRQVDDRRDGMHSNRCFMNLQLEVARAYLHETFYFPHNVDFRGRAYPIPPYLNHMGADHCRGLLTFDKGRELGANGLWWLRVHLANVYGFDKASFDERHDFSVTHIEDIRDSARHPLDGKGWWTQAEDRWQCLATCIELTNALDSPDPTKFVSQLPIHQDGTCNGLQHYAALGGDAIGAMQVNLEPGERPADIYSTVARMVEASIAKDAEAGHSLGKVLEGKIKRKIVKQTVMTNVYGVTLSGAKAQVHRQLEDHYPDLLTGVLHGKFWAATYIAQKVFESLATMFTGAHHIQYWLAECASRIAGSITPQQVQYIEENLQGNSLPPSETWKKSTQRGALKYGPVECRSRTPVVWTTPLRMPVVQPYRNSMSKRVSTNLNILAVNDTTAADPVVKKKQVQAFPPNFIHSLDATHMILTALKCDELGLAFAAVHDSFWTHAGDVDAMNGVIRDAFIRMHSEDIIGRLDAEFRARYSGSMYLMGVPRHSSIGKKIGELRGANKRCSYHGRPSNASLLEDLVAERKRLKLLRSEDSAERVEGEAMVTPASVFHDFDGNESSFLPKLDASLGDVPNPLMTEREAFFKQFLRDRGIERTNADVSDAEGDVLDASSETQGGPNENASSALHIPELDGRLEPEEEERREKERKARARASMIWAQKYFIWLPLDFPPVPKRGDYDVKRLRGSQYFFS